MDYFISNYNLISLKFGEPGSPGLRGAQIGAICGLVAHFAVSNESAIVVMPTGSGKSMVIMTSSFLLRGKRVLIVTPSKLLRNQISEDFNSLSSVKKFGVLPIDAKTPKVLEVEEKLGSLDEWLKLKKFDVVVATPNCISPEQPGVIAPPSDLFDVIYVDEAHHSPARTWIAILSAFVSAKKILVTATPYRNDRKEIKGKFAFVYSLKQAKGDGVFGEIEFIPVKNVNDGDDIAIAMTAEATLTTDRNSGYDHFLIVRTDSKTKADELHEIYKTHTKLKLKVIHSKHSDGTIKTVIKELKEKKLDGVIAVSMLGEGFDFPNLKIAAIHSPHKSLAVTLQFIGRFARTSGSEKLGKAKFIAIPNDIKIESEKLYDEGASWEEIVTNLSETRIDSEIATQRELDSFEILRDVEETEDFSLSSLNPYSHVKIYRVHGASLDVEAKILQQKMVIKDYYNSELNARILLCKREQVPRWSLTNAFAQVHHDLHVVYYHEESKLLFINSSDKSAALYEEIATLMAPSGYHILELSEVNRVIRNINKPEFFNIGMKNSVSGGKTESYRIISGNNAQQAVSKADGSLFHRGHVFGKGEDNNQEITLGYSSSSKVWSQASVKIPVLVSWCRRLAEKILDESTFLTNSNLDHLQVGELISAITEKVLFADWNPSALNKNLCLVNQATGETVRIWNADIIVVSNDQNEVVFKVEFGSTSKIFRFNLLGVPKFSSQDSIDLVVDGDEQISLEGFFNEDPISFYLSDLSRLRGRSLYRSVISSTQLRPNCIQAIDWSGVNIKKEKRFAGGISIHERLEEWLSGRGYDLVVFDDRAQEIADFVCIKKDGMNFCIDLFHAKASLTANKGLDVGNMYEVCGQASKSFLRINRPLQVMTRLEARVVGGSSIVVGDLSKLRELTQQCAELRTKCTIYAVQPGLDTSQNSDSINSQILATETFLSKIQDIEFKVIGG